MDPIEKDIDNLLFARNLEHLTEHKDRYIDHYLEQYRIYLHIFNCTNDRSQKSNNFFLGLNTAIIGILGYVEIKNISEVAFIFTVVPFIGLTICYSWYKIICAYQKLNRAKFSVIHKVEKKLPIALFETEWHFLGEGRDKKKYHPLSEIEKNIPMIFILFYIILLVVNLR